MSGRSNFTNCQHKKVTFESKPAASGHPIYDATLECPNPQGDGMNSEFIGRFFSWHTSQEKARNTLRRLAAAEACGGCAMSCMSRVDLLKQQLDETNTETLLLESRGKLKELQRQQAEDQAAVVAQATQEVDGINQVNLGADAIASQVDPTILRNDLT